MYNVDDAVARVDSYVVSVVGGGAHVGERRMVRIDEVGRSVATASLLDAPGNGAGAEADEAQLESSSSGGRRRGRSGGQRRSPASTAEKNDG